MDKLHLLSNVLCDDLVKELREYLNDHPILHAIKHANKALAELYGEEYKYFTFAGCYCHALPEDDDGWLRPRPSEVSPSWKSIVQSIKARKDFRKVINEIEDMHDVAYLLYLTSPSGEGYPPLADTDSIKGLLNDQHHHDVGIFDD